MNIPHRRISICALVAIRNEACYLRGFLSYLARQDIDVVILDDGSSEETREILRHFIPSPIIEIRKLGFTSSFSLSKILRAKMETLRHLPHDWFIFQDADEILEHRDPGKTLRDAIHEADEMGFNALNFDEFVFLPSTGEDYTNADYQSGMLRYYFFKPHENRLNRAWKRNISATVADTGGHRLRGIGIHLCETNHILRHYIVLSQTHAYEKYLTRRFSREDLAKGWHSNRLDFTEQNLQLPKQHEFIFSLPYPESKQFNRSQGVGAHFWHWTRSC